MKLVASLSAGALAAFVAAVPAAAQQPIRLDQPQSIEGRLEQSDPVLPESENTRFDDYRVEIPAGQRVRITVRSEAIDPVVTVYRAGNMDEPLAENDDDGESLNSRLNFTASEGGSYVVRVRSFGGEAFGSYTLAATPLAPLPDPVSASRGGRRERSSWRSFDGALTNSDAEGENTYFDDYRVSLRAGDRLIVSVDSTEFDPIVQILPAAAREGQAIEIDDDAGPGTNALLGFEAEEAGDYIIRVTSFGSNATGRYRLRIGD